MSRTRHHRGYGKTMNYTPSAWTNTMMTRPARAKTRDLLSKAKTRDVDLTEFPLAKKPHVYYW